MNRGESAGWTEGSPNRDPMERIRGGGLGPFPSTLAVGRGAFRQLGVSVEDGVIQHPGAGFDKLLRMTQSRRMGALGV